MEHPFGQFGSVGRGHSRDSLFPILRLLAVGVQSGKERKS